MGPSIFYLGRPCAKREVGVEFPRGVYGLKGVQRFELFCQLFSLRLSAEPAGSYNTIHFWVLQNPFSQDVPIPNLLGGGGGGGGSVDISWICTLTKNFVNDDFQ